nr:PREDICTED: lariat debranching enzyme isoform X2 [Bemisia tabaci]
MLVAVVGCLHGELDNVYENIKKTEEKEGKKIDLLICCGDFQATRNIQDLRCMAVPAKYQNMCSFYKYYSGEKLAPVLTIFVGGNHEASNYLQELPYGGWVAPNVFYLGYAGVVRFGGLRIGGISGISKGADYMKGHFEKPPYTEQTKRSVYHVRNLEVFRMKQLSSSLDIMISHDWPKGIWEHGNRNQLLRHKPFFRDDMDNDKLGSEPCRELLDHLKPSYWLAAHLHTKFVALVPHVEKKDENIDEPGPIKSTRFLALDKCLKRKRYLQLLEIASDESKAKVLEYDLEWLTILFLTNHLLSVEKSYQYMPGPCKTERWIFKPSQEEMDLVLQKFNGDLTVPSNFVRTAAAYSSHNQTSTPQRSSSLCVVNPQTTSFCSKLCIDDPLVLLNGDESPSVPAEVFIPTFESPSVPAEVSIPTFESPSLSISLPKPKYDDSQTSLTDYSELFETAVSDDSQNVISNLSFNNQNTQESLLDSERDISVATQDSSAISVSQVESLTVSEDVPGKPDNILDEESDLNSSLPTKKKFKRRNQSMYAVSTDDTSN